MFIRKNNNLKYDSNTALKYSSRSDVFDIDDIDVIDDIDNIDDIDDINEATNTQNNVQMIINKSESDINKHPDQYHKKNIIYYTIILIAIIYITLYGNLLICNKKSKSKNQYTTLGDVYNSKIFHRDII